MREGRHGIRIQTMRTTSSASRIGRCEKPVWDAACITCFSCSIETGEADESRPANYRRFCHCFGTSGAHFYLTSDSTVLSISELLNSRASELKPDAATLYPWQFCILCGDMHARYLEVAGKRGKQSSAAHLAIFNFSSDPLCLLCLPQTSGALTITSRCVCCVASASIGATADGLVARQTDEQAIAGCKILRKNL